MHAKHTESFSLPSKSRVLALTEAATTPVSVLTGIRTASIGITGAKLIIHLGLQHSRIPGSC